MAAPGARELPRLLIVNWRDIRSPEAGGAEVHLQEVARRMLRDGFEVVQYASAYPGCVPVEVVDGVEIHRQGGNFLFNYHALWNLRRWVRRHRIDVVIDDSNKIPFLLPWISPVPVVVRFQHLFGRSIFTEAKLPVALYVYFFESLIRFAYKGVRVLTFSRSTEIELQAKGLTRIAVGNHGMDLDQYRVQPEVSTDPVLIGHVGRLMRYKNVDTLVRAFALVRAQIPQARLAIAGSGPQRADLEKLAEELGVTESVRFLGFVTEAEKVRLYNEAAVIVNPSLKEGWGLTSVEANACGTPVVAADSPGLRDSVRNGETGLLVPPLEPAAYAAAILSILKNPAEAARLREGGLAWARAHTWDKTAVLTADVVLKAWREGRPS